MLNNSLNWFWLDHFYFSFDCYPHFLNLFCLLSLTLHFHHEFLDFWIFVLRIVFKQLFYIEASFPFWLLLFSLFQSFQTINHGILPILKLLHILFIQLVVICLNSPFYFIFLLLILFSLLFYELFLFFLLLFPFLQSIFIVYCPQSPSW